jgi:hybrid polyketide synthase/nonribosomal peptide synthetase FtdB
MINADRGPNLFCFPPAGGHGLVYRQLAAHVDRQVIAFSYIGGDDMVERYADHIEAIQPTGPYAVLGYSLGGNVAFEVAQELERRGRQVTDVLILDSYRITQACELIDELLAGFEHELRGHLREHINSDQLTQETLEQAKEYVRYCNRRVSRGTVHAVVTVIAEHGSARRFGPGMPGSWHGSSATRIDVVAGSGAHAEMLSPGHVATNGAHAQHALTGVADAA